MSRHTRRPARIEATAWCALALAVPSAGAQTIADYSRAQRAMLESTMTQAAAHSAGLGASTPAASVPASVVASAPASRIVPPPSGPAVQVSGVFAAASGALVEVMVNAAPYLLGVGQGVPGTSWRVEAIAVDRVVLARPGTVGTAGADSVRRVFSLPALR